MPSILWVNDNGTTSVVEVDDEGNRVDLPKSEPFGGKGDHDNNGKVGGAAPALRIKRGKRR